MSNKWSGVKSIVDYYQDEEPSNPKEGEIWYRPSAKSSYLYNGTEFRIVRGYDSIVGRYGYDIGGVSSSRFSTIDRVLFPFDSGTSTVVSNLTQESTGAAAANSSQYGFIMGGEGNAGATTSLINRIDFPFDSGTSTTLGGLSYSRHHSAGCNSTIHGFTMGGSGGSYHSRIDRITFPFNSGNSSNVGNLSASTSYNAGSNSSNYGFSSAGFYHDGSYHRQTTINRLTFPFDSGPANHVGNLAITSSGTYSSPACNSSTHSYQLGGYITGGDVYSTIARWTFPFDSGTANNVGTLSVSLKNSHTTVNSSNYGYSMGGYRQDQPVPYQSTIERFLFPFDSGTASSVGNLTTTKSNTVGVDETDFVTQFI